MEIVSLGHSSFRIKSKDMTIVTDPFDPQMVGLKYPNQKADIVTVSHQHPDHNNTNAITGSVSREKGVFVIDQPGEYEIGGVEIRAIPTFHDEKAGGERGSNLVMIMRVDDIFVVHLGDIGHTLTDKKIEDIGVVDVLLVPVGGTFTADPKMASNLVSQLEPSITIPMHYKVEGMKGQFDQLLSVEGFLKEMGNEEAPREKKLKINKTDLPENMQVIVLEA